MRKLETFSIKKKKGVSEGNGHLNVLQGLKRACTIRDNLDVRVSHIISCKWLCCFNYANIFCLKNCV